MNFFHKLAWPQVTLFAVLAACITALVIAGYIPKETFLALVSGLAGWLAPSPIKKEEK